MRPIRRLLSILKLTVALMSLCIFYQLSLYNRDWDPVYSLRYSWLEYTDEDGGPEAQCNCTAVQQEDTEELQQVKLLTITRDFRQRVQIPDEYYINATRDCREFLSSRKYITFPLSEEEEDFPLAYSIVVHHKVHNFERLLRAVYAPQNIYCIHVDSKSEDSVVSAIRAIASCLPNVYMATRTVDVVYASWTRVQADINCMSDLYEISSEWKYFLNLCGQDFPIKTNLEIVRALRSLRGGNSMETEKLPEFKKWRVTKSFTIADGKIKATGKAKEPPPFNLPIKSGNAYIVVSRGYIQSVLQDSRVQALIEWAKDTYSPDEFLWATIQRMSGVPGSTWPHTKYDLTDINAMARLVKWGSHEGSQGSVGAVYPECKGHHVRDVCVYGAGDLNWILEHHHLFANKFDIETDPVVVYCLERYLRSKALAELQSS